MWPLPVLLDKMAIQNMVRLKSPKMVKGDRKRKNTCFKKGHQPYVGEDKPHREVVQEAETSPPKIVRLSREMTEWVLNPPVGSISETTDNRAMLLRPIKSFVTEQQPRETEAEYRNLAIDKVLSLINAAAKEHACDKDLEWDKVREVKWGLCWTMALKCEHCGYKGQAKKLYHEAKRPGRGRKAGTANIGLQVGLTHSMISNTGARNILMAANVVPPSYSAMQKQANKVGQAITNLNTESMAVHRQQVRDVCEHRGLGSNHPIPVEGDGRYNTPLWSGAGKTPYQPATQMTYTVCENVTPAKKIIAVQTTNKLCSRAKYLRSVSHENITCPNHSGRCTADIRPQDSIGDEERAARLITEHVSKDTNIGFFTSDGDSRAQKGATSTNNNIVCLKDTRHLTQCMRKQLEKLTFKPSIFPELSGEDRTRAHNRFAREISQRASGEYKLCYKHHDGKLNAIKRDLTYATDAIIMCFSGKCGKMCQKYSYICKGRGRKACYLPSNIKTVISGDNETLLRKCLGMRLSGQAVEHTKLNSNTQKCEGVNRLYLKTNPKCVTWPTNFPGRIHSGVHLLNEGLAKSTEAKLSAMGACLSQSVMICLKRQEKREHYLRQYKLKPSVKYRLKRYVCERYKNYDSDKQQKVTYKKGLCMPKISPKFLGDHNYVKRK